MTTSLRMNNNRARVAFHLFIRSHCFILSPPQETYIFSTSKEEFVLKSSIQQTEKPRWENGKEDSSNYICLIFTSCIVLKLLLVWRKQKKSNTKRTPTPVIPCGVRCDEKSRTKPASFLLCLLVSIILKFICARAVVE